MRIRIHNTDFHYYYRAFFQTHFFHEYQDEDLCSVKPEFVVQLRVSVLEIPGGQDLTKEQFFMEEQNFKKIEIVDFLELTS